MKKPYNKPNLKLKGFYVSDKIAANIPTPPGDLNGMGLDSDVVSNSITSYVVGSTNPSPSPSTSPLNG